MIYNHYAVDSHQWQLRTDLNGSTTVAGDGPPRTTAGGPPANVSLSGAMPRTTGTAFRNIETAARTIRWGVDAASAVDSTFRSCAFGVLVDGVEGLRGEAIFFHSRSLSDLRGGDVVTSFPWEGPLSCWPPFAAANRASGAAMEGAPASGDRSRSASATASWHEGGGVGSPLQTDRSGGDVSALWGAMRRGLGGSGWRAKIHVHCANLRLQQNPKTKFHGFKATRIQ